MITLAKVTRTVRVVTREAAAETSHAFRRLVETACAWAALFAFLAIVARFGELAIFAPWPEARLEMEICVPAGLFIAGLVLHLEPLVAKRRRRRRHWTYEE